jgi:chromosome segregation ATPase
VDLVEYIGPLPDKSQRAPVSRPAETESTTAVAGGVSEDPGRIIYELEQCLAAETKRTEQSQRYISTNEAINEKTAENERLQAEWQAEFTAAQQLRSENDRLQAEALQAQKYVSEANEKINQQTRTIEHLSDKVRSLERFNDDKENDLDHLRQLRRTNEAVIKELRTLLTYALSKK